MRIGEIAIVGPDNEEKRLFIQSVCQKLELAAENITFGRLPINDQLVLHLYGIAIQPHSQPIAWDLIAKKMLGYVVLFPWSDADSFDRIKPILDHLLSRYDVPVVVAASVSNGRQPVPQQFYEGGVSLTAEGKFMFCDVRNPTSVRKILLALVDSLINKMP
jgi:signal recognition particle receptor subunit beta